MPVRRSVAACLLAVLALALALAPAAQAAERPPEVPLAAYVIMDGTDGTILAAQRPRARRSIASLTKMMTAQVALRDGSLDQVVTVPVEATTIGESVVGLRAGQQLTRAELLDGVMIWSGNDAAEALAIGVGGSQAAFVRRMNREARRLGLGGTSYRTPYGLDTEGQYSTALDQARLARALMRDPRLRRVVRKRSVTVNGTEFPARNNLLGSYPGMDGVKTGHTGAAGWCLAASAIRDGRRIFVVALGAPDEATRDRAVRTLLDWGFSRFRRVRLVADGTTVARLPADWGRAPVPVETTKDVERILRAGQRVRTSVVLPTRAPFGRAGDVVGRLDVRVGAKVVTSVPLALTEDVLEPSFTEQARWVGGRALDRLLDPGSWFDL